MRQKLDEFLDVARRYRQMSGGSNPDFSLMGDLHQREATVKEILKALDPELAGFSLDGMIGDMQAVDQVERGLGVLADRDEWRARLAPEAPALLADRLHPWIWNAAQPLWDSRHFRLAVQAAATSLNARLQEKVNRRDVSDDKLVQEVFREANPERGKARLRIPGDPSDRTVQSRQRGAQQLGLGCFFAIRNPAAHEDNEWDQQIALEQLAALSVFARLVDQCEVRKVEPSPGV